LPAAWWIQRQGTYSGPIGAFEGVKIYIFARDSLQIYGDAYRQLTDRTSRTGAHKTITDTLKLFPVYMLPTVLGRPSGKRLTMYRP
jgi:hypothetical protein